MHKSQNYTVDLESLVRIQTLVNSQLVDGKAPDGIFYRVQDFSTSHSVVVTQFMDEYKITYDIMPRAKTTDELHGLVCSMTTPYITGENHFTTALLSPALRHYLNDACRLLDPYAELFALKFSDVKLRKKDSLSLVIQDIRAVRTISEIDLDFLIELYDVWNDYKHRQTKGLHVSSWGYKNSEIVKPTIELPQSGMSYVKLSGLTVDSFIEKTKATILEFLLYLSDMSETK